MRTAFAVIFVILIAALSVCANIGHRSKKKIGRSVALISASLIPPVIGNLIIIVSQNRLASTIGCYIYFIGMDQAMFALLRFAFCYCEVEERIRKGFVVAYILLIIDVIQLLANPFLGHAFETEVVEVAGADYYRLVPLLGQAFHRVVDYGVLAAVLVIFIVKAVNSPRVNSEKYTVILLTIVFTALWQTFYIFSRTPVDRSMIGFGVFGILVFYFSLYYRPMRLLDRMLATIASEMPEALFFFDSTKYCIWANDRAKKLVGIEGEEYITAGDRLRDMFGLVDCRNDGDVAQISLGEGEDRKSYVMQRRLVTDSKGRFAGSFLSIRDNTDEQRLLQKEIWNATHDPLTAVYNRAGYELLLSGMELESTFLLLIDADNFKLVNDNFGHETGDRVLIKIADTAKTVFGEGSFVCRIGGDEFVVLIPEKDVSLSPEIGAKIDRINSMLVNTADGLPKVSVSAGVAHGAGRSIDHKQLFAEADNALYRTKGNGRNGYTFYK